MIPITQADEQLFSAVIVAARLGRAEVIVEPLAQRYERDWADPLAGFPYALAMLAALQSGGQQAPDSFGYTEILDTLGDLLYGTPEHWLGRFLRIHARTLLPTAPAEYRKYVAAERAKAVEDTAELLERQSRAEWRPWFACTHLLAARLAWETDPRDTGRVAAEVKTAAGRAVAPVPFRSLASVLAEPFLWYQAQNGLPERETVAATMETLFPYLRSVRDLRAGTAP
jgi:hypothetical protein